MFYCHFSKALGRTLKGIMQKSAPFVWKVLLFAGGFRKVLPVVPSGSREQILNECVKSTFLYHSFQTVWLTENLRLHLLLHDLAAAEEAVQFYHFLVQVG